MDEESLYAPQELVAELAALEDLHAMRARVDPVAFASYVMRDEETNAPITLQPMHVEWHRLATAHRRLLIWAHVEAGKSTMLSIARVLFEIGQNPNIRIGVISNTGALAQKICMTVAKYITQSPEYKRVFPGVVPAKKLPWTMSTLYVERDAKAKDATLQTFGVHGNILGSRLDLLIIDDILDYENTLSLYRRDDLDNWIRSTVEGRMSRKGRIICVGTAWHHDDLYHRFARREDWFAVRYPIVDDETGAFTWPARWSPERIEEKRIALGPIEYARQLLCIAHSNEESRFRKEWLQQCLDRGEGRPVTHSLQGIPPGYGVYTGVDLSVGNVASDLTVLFTIIVHPDDTREVLCIESGRWQGPEIVARIMDTHDRFHSIVMVENNATQEFIVQFTKRLSAVPVRSFTTTGSNIHHEFGLESMATEMSASKWIIPSRGGVGATREIQAWIQEMLFYDPKAHPGDRLMASWFSREAARTGRPKKGFQKKLDLLTR